MNLLTFLQAQPQAAGAGNWGFFLMMILIFVVMWFFLIRPQQKKQKELAKFRNSLQKGDKIVTIGGIYGVIDEIKDLYVIVEIDANVKIRVDKNSIVKDVADIPVK